MTFTFEQAAAIATALSSSTCTFQLIQTESGYSLSDGTMPPIAHNDLAELVNLLLVTHIKAWNSLPPRFPTRHLFYEPDGDWLHLTAAGREIYERNKSDCDRLYNAVYLPRLDRWAGQAVEELLADVVSVRVPDEHIQPYAWELEQLKKQLAAVDTRIARLHTRARDPYLDQLKESFPMGMVGGSGNPRNIQRLNKRREASLDRTIDAAKQLVPLYGEQSRLTQQINAIESGQRWRNAQAQAARLVRKAKFWRDLKVGDEIPLGNTNGNPRIKKKNAKSLISDNGTKYPRSEIIGKEADERYDELIQQD